MIVSKIGESMIDEKALEVINEILKRGGTVEIRKRRDEIVIIEIKGKIKYSVSADAQ